MKIPLLIISLLFLFSCDQAEEVEQDKNEPVIEQEALEVVNEEVTFADGRNYYGHVYEGKHAVYSYESGEWEEWTEPASKNLYFMCNDESLKIYTGNGVREFSLEPFKDPEVYSQDGVSATLYSMLGNIPNESQTTIFFLIADDLDLPHSMKMRQFQQAGGIMTSSSFEFVDFEDLPQDFQTYLKD